MKHTIKLLTLAAILTAVFGLTGCPGPVNNYIEPPHEHVWTEVTTEYVAPTCTTKGSKTYVCTCGETKVEELDALGHDWVLESDTATCTEDGKKTYKCSRCNETRIEDSPAHHTFIAGGCDKCGEYQYADGIKFHLNVTTQEKYNETYGNNTNTTKTVRRYSFTQNNDTNDIWDDYYLSFNASTYSELIEKYGNLFEMVTRQETDWQEECKILLDKLLSLKGINNNFNWYSPSGLESNTSNTENYDFRLLGNDPTIMKYYIVTTN